MDLELFPEQRVVSIFSSAIFSAKKWFSYKRQTCPFRIFSSFNHTTVKTFWWTLLFHHLSKWLMKYKQRMTGGKKRHKNTEPHCHPKYGLSFSSIPKDLSKPQYYSFKILDRRLVHNILATLCSQWREFTGLWDQIISKATTQELKKFKMKSLKH